MKYHKIKKAFTLAEILITLGIIGVIAAITLPTLIANYEKEKTVNQLKATYSILAQAFEMAKSEYGDMSNWDIGNYIGQTSGSSQFAKSFTEKYFVPYIKPTKIYGLTTFKYIGYDGIHYLNNDLDNSLYGGQSYIVNLANGSIVAFSLDGHCDLEHKDENGNTICDSPWYYTSVYIVADINGLKRPNTYGKDIFVMRANTNKFEFYSYSNIENNRNMLLKYCSKESKENRQCGRLIQYDGWKINYNW